MIERMQRLGLVAVAAWAVLSAWPQIAGLAAIVPDHHPIPLKFRVLSQVFLLLPLILFYARLRLSLFKRITAFLLIGFIAIYPHFPSPFFDYVWDVFLVESIFVYLLSAALIATPRLAPYAVWPSRLLLFKLMFCMGVVKFIHGMPEWRDGTALRYFWANQPMPGFIAWHASTLPDFMQRAMCAFVFLVEMPGPFLIFAGPRARKIYFWLNLFLQAGIFVSGNYSFFNILTIIVSFSLLERQPASEMNQTSVFFNLARNSVLVVFAGWLLCSAWYVQRTLFPRDGYLHETSWIFLKNEPQREVSPPARWLLQVYAAGKTSNPYALFGMISKYRLEIALEGSRDGREWQKFSFKVRPEALNRPPLWYAPHHWRLDHQMYYESFRIRDPALHSRHSYFLGVRWFPNFAAELLTADSRVLSLLAGNPFNGPPAFLRLRYAYYGFTNPAEQRASGNYWKTESPHPGQFFEGVITKESLARLP